MSKSSLLSTNSVVHNYVSLSDNRSTSSDSFCLSDASSSKTNLSDFHDSYVSDNLNKQSEDNLSNKAYKKKLCLGFPDPT